MTLVIPRSPIDREFASFVRRRCDGVSLIGLLTLSKLREKEKWDVRELSAVIGIPQDLLEGYLDDLSARSLVLREGKECRLSGYRGKPTETKVTAIDAKRRILSFAEKEGEVSSKDVQELLGIEGTKSYRLLKELVEDGQIEPIYKGKYARYRIK